MTGDEGDPSYESRDRVVPDHRRNPLKPLFAPRGTTAGALLHAPGIRDGAFHRENLSRLHNGEREVTTLCGV